MFKEGSNVLSLKIPYVIVSIRRLRFSHWHRNEPVNFKNPRINLYKTKNNATSTTVRESDRTLHIACRVFFAWYSGFGSFSLLPIARVCISRIRKVLNSFSMILQSVYVHDVKFYIRISVYFNGRRPHIAALSTSNFPHRTQLLRAETQRPSREGVELASIRWIRKIFTRPQLLLMFTTIQFFAKQCRQRADC